MNWTMTETNSRRESGENRGQFRAYCPPAAGNPPVAGTEAPAKSPLECRGAFRAYQPIAVTPGK
jgi:hypothetical protein